MYYKQLSDVISTIGWDYPKIVGLDWSILSVIEVSFIGVNFFVATF